MRANETNSCSRWLPRIDIFLVCRTNSSYSFAILSTSSIAFRLKAPSCPTIEAVKRWRVEEEGARSNNFSFKANHDDGV